MDKKIKKVLKRLRKNIKSEPPKTEKVQNHTEVYFSSERGEDRLKENFKSSGSEK